MEFEIGDLVSVKRLDGVFEVIGKEISHQSYDLNYWNYTVQNIETKEEISELGWNEISLID